MTALVRMKNDELRQTLVPSSDASVILSREVSQHPALQHILEAVRTFDDFNDGNDPYKEHDFGAVKVTGELFYFQMSHYDKDPRRNSDAMHGYNHFVITVMHSSEY